MNAAAHSDYDVLRETVISGLVAAFEARKRPGYVAAELNVAGLPARPDAKARLFSEFRAGDVRPILERVALATGRRARVFISPGGAPDDFSVAADFPAA